ncbi:MAG: tRNA lysidine(34) synthetase TilS [Roseibium sp.]
MPNAPELRIEPAGLSASEIDQLFAPLKPFDRIALAVSGGSDSICLLRLFHDWHTRSGWSGACEVLTVDHGLRLESVEETIFVQELSISLGYACSILRWSDGKPQTGVQEAARQARYRLFAKHMSASGTEALVLAHHKDDQAETFLDRLTRGSGVFGLGAMSVDERGGAEGLRLLRPLLDVSKARLVESLKLRNQPWCEDPSNDSTKYKRSRLRKIAGLLADEGFSQDRILTTVRQMRRTRNALEFVLADTFTRLVEDHPAGPLRLAMDAFRKLPEEIRLRLLVLVIQRVTGKPYLPRLKKIEALDRNILSQKKVRQTFGGAVVERDDKHLCVWKEAGRSPPTTLVDVSGCGTWDDRFDFDVKPSNQKTSGCGVLMLGILRNAPVKQRDWPVLQGWPKEAFASSPVFWCSNGILSIDSESALFITGAVVEPFVIKLNRIPFPPNLAGNYIDILDAETKV